LGRVSKPALLRPRSSAQLAQQRVNQLASRVLSREPSRGRTPSGDEVSRARASQSSLGLRESGHRTWVQEVLYGSASPVYDAFVRWAFWPLGGETACRQQFARWLSIEPGQTIASLCCGTGTTDRALIAIEPSVAITGVDLGQSQLARARHKDRTHHIDYRLGNASETGLAGASFDRVLIVGALQEMPHRHRLVVLREAKRLCRLDGRVLGIEIGRTKTRWSAICRGAWLLHWVPGNPETATTRELVASSLSAEMQAVGLVPTARYTTRPDWFEGILARRDNGDGEQV
jgi:ubiquinone/menaquinone biosynthesis C-methylase UbiE